MFDVFVIGGGINGIAIARDAAGRGFKVAVAEKGDLAEQTSSKSTKLLHGGLRYLEYFDATLVRYSLQEREVLLQNMPHIAWPLRFVLPLHPDMRFANDTPTSRLLGKLMPWLRGRRPEWIIRLGLWLYDHLGGRRILPPTATLNLHHAAEGQALQKHFVKAYEYSDVWVDDSRLVALMARDASERKAHIMTRNRVQGTRRKADHWQITTEKGVFTSRTLVNAAGPWVENIIHAVANLQSPARMRLIKGSHIVVPRLYVHDAHDKAYCLLGKDGRIIFALPYEQNYTLIGTTEESHDDINIAPQCSDQEIHYLCDCANRYLAQPITPDDVVWHYSGVRPLYNDGACSASATTREYVLQLDRDGALLLNVFGGKITTHRKLAEDALAKLGIGGTPWTLQAPLAGGDFAAHEKPALLARLKADFPNLSASQAVRLFNSYGKECWQILAGDWGVHFGAGLYACEVDHLIAHEFAQNAQDILWRRSKLGLHLNADATAALNRYIEGKHDAYSCH